jgi:hypothetical protein
MLTTLMLSIACVECPEQVELPPAPPASAVTQSILAPTQPIPAKAADGRFFEGVEISTSKTIGIKRSSIPSILKVSEEAAKDVPTGMAAIYLESARPVLDDREARTLDSMLSALRLSVEPQAIEKPTASPRAFKVSTVRNDDAVDPKEEAQQSIYASIQSTVIGI